MLCCVVQSQLSLDDRKFINTFYLQQRLKQGENVEERTKEERKEVVCVRVCVWRKKGDTRTKIVDVMCTLHINWTHIGRTSALESYALALASITIYTCMDFLSILFPSMLLIVCVHVCVFECGQYTLLYGMLWVCVCIWSNFQKTYQTNIELGLPKWGIPTLVTHSANALIFSNIIQCASLD